MPSPLYENVRGRKILVVSCYDCSTSHLSCTPRPGAVGRRVVTSECQ